MTQILLFFVMIHLLTPMGMVIKKTLYFEDYASLIEDAESKLDYHDRRNLDYHYKSILAVNQQLFAYSNGNSGESSVNYFLNNNSVNGSYALKTLEKMRENGFEVEKYMKKFEEIFNFSYDSSSRLYQFMVNPLEVDNIAYASVPFGLKNPEYPSLYEFNQNLKETDKSFDNEQARINLNPAWMRDTSKIKSRSYFSMCSDLEKISEWKVALRKLVEEDLARKNNS